eukprot:GHUV01057167.1.p1 GENE.GHUV01057167.1~~GHUV01057167.1.p1  ORF type:complete len:158 (+),score=48.54 GHUV01057167.1:148-621(+)
MSEASTIAGSLAVAAAGAFAGAALLISAVDVPAFEETSMTYFYKYFPAMYKRAARMQGSLVMIGAHAAAVAAAKSDDRDTTAMWAASGLLLGSVVPYTFLVMMPTNKTIIKQDTSDECEQQALLTKWSRMHFVRTAVSCASFAVMVAALVRTSRRSQ